jgi:hypothetical protein
MSLRLIGDCHGDFQTYSHIVEDSEYSIQLGDFGFNEMYKAVASSNIDDSNHQFFGGNHEDMDYYYSLPHSLGNYGFTILNSIAFFFVRGAESIDQDWRKADMAMGKWGGRKLWWEEEQMSMRQLGAAIEHYKDVKPSIVLTHTCPQFLKNIVLKYKYGDDNNCNVTRTEAALENMWGSHKPKLWVFGHFHCYFNQVIGGTRFICLDEYQYADLDCEAIHVAGESYAY